MDCVDGLSCLTGIRECLLGAPELDPVWNILRPSSNLTPQTGCKVSEVFVCFTVITEAFIMAYNENLSWYDSRSQLCPSVVLAYLFNCAAIHFSWRTTTWQEVLKEELEKRSSEWCPFEEGKHYEEFSPENRVSFFPSWFFTLMTIDVGVLFVMPRTFWGW